MEQLEHPSVPLNSGMKNSRSEGWLINAVLFQVLLLVALTISQAGCGGTDPGGTGKIPVVAHVFVLVEENHSFSSVIGNSAMPYTNSLAQKNALATQYYANRHNSLPNYFMLTVGDLVTTNDLFTGTVTADNVVRALTSAGKTWRMYAESLPGKGFTGKGNVPYARDHNPFAYFSDVLNDSSQADNIVPITQLASDIQNNALPDYAMIVPNLANDCIEAQYAIARRERFSGCSSQRSGHGGVFLGSRARGPRHAARQQP